MVKKRVVYALEHFKSSYDNKGFTLSHCWMLLKDTKKWETSYAILRKLERAKNKGNGNSSTDEAITEREERWRKEKHATAKSFFDLQLRALEVEEDLVKFRLLEDEAKTGLMDVDSKSTVLEAESKNMTEENRIMLTDLAAISDPERRAWIEKKQKMILARDASGALA
ncbi:hypothetical protein QYE76_007974 [Lolium multiflorum]|uniref:No apical meristem-associated C-terminal domain-containing protein n=1 Tax=Lolium multiflorum TaxID=4521 RepID=A0AAD8QI00_LOLMU|nr:hypothetical protein QYE76_007974 [Lolium multiflorum]